MGPSHDRHDRGFTEFDVFDGAPAPVWLTARTWNTWFLEEESLLTVALVAVDLVEIQLLHVDPLLVENRYS